MPNERKIIITQTENGFKLENNFNDHEVIGILELIKQNIIIQRAEVIRKRIRKSKK